MASSAYRVPNVDDLAKIRVRGRNVLVPNLDLTPERSYTFEATVSPFFDDIFSLSGSSLQVDITAFYTLVDDAIIRSDYQLPNGDTLLEVSSDLYRVQANINAENAYVYGVSANLSFRFADGWQFQSSFNYQKGRSKIINEDEQPLAHIPPNYGKTSLAYEADRWKCEFSVRYNGNKPLDEYAPGSSDNEDFATPVGALAWTTLNLYGSYQVTDFLALSAGFENIADVHYRMFSSGVSAPGRNAFLAISATF
jgi:hemoglobin/transferrin/lactoferrin receptor protein